MVVKCACFMLYIVLLPSTNYQVLVYGRVYYEKPMNLQDRAIPHSVCPPTSMIGRVIHTDAISNQNRTSSTHQIPTTSQNGVIVIVGIVLFVVST